MEMFGYQKATTIAEALREAAAAKGEARFIAGGTTLVDLMKLNVEGPKTVVDINALPLNKIEEVSDGKLKIGALVRNGDLAHNAVVLRDYAVLSQALLQGASAQLRNMATTGGNLMQRTRCMYFRNITMACNKREPGSGCSALDGENRSLAILGASKACIATNPSDMNVALSALEATIQIESMKGSRDVAVDDFFVLPGKTPHRENTLAPFELITSVTLPAARPKTTQLYLKLRDRASYEFALASAAVVVEVVRKKIAFIRLALGGVGTKPWRALEAEEVLQDNAIDDEVFKRAAEAALASAVPQSQNGFKIELAKRCIVHALKLATQKTLERR